MASLEDWKLHAFEQILDNHLLPSYKKELFASVIDTKKRIQDYVFGQKLTIIIFNYNKTYQNIILEYI